MTKKEIQAMIDQKEARKKEIKDAIKKATTVEELRSLQDGIEGVNDDIENYRSIMDDMPDDPAQAAPPVASGAEQKRSEEAAASAESRAKGLGAQAQFNPLATYQVGAGDGGDGSESRQLDSILKMPVNTPEQQSEMKSALHATPEYRSAFLKSLLGKSLTDTEKRAYDSGTTAVIPTTTSDILFKKMVKIAPLINEITLLRVVGNVKFAVQDTHDDAALHTENAAITPAGDKLVYVELGGYDITKVIRISKTIQTMAISAFEGWLTDMLADDIAVKIEDFTINGTGSSQPNGIEHAVAWEADTNQVQFTNGGAPAYDDVVNLIALLPARYTNNAKFLCNNKFLYGQLAKIKDSNKRPILVQDFSNPIAQRVLGFPVLISDKVADNTLYFGDFKQMVGNLAQDVTVEVSTASGFLNRSVDFLGSALYDCDVALKDAFCKLSEASAA